MARRIRSLHPEFLDDERLCLCSLGARFMSAAVLLLCDDEGRARGRTGWIVSQIWPLGGVTAAQVDEYIAELQDCHYLVRYEVDGSTYVWVRNFKRYQRPQKPQASRLPPVPDEYATSTLPVRYQSPPDWSGLEGSGVEGVGVDAREAGVEIPISPKPDSDAHEAPATGPERWQPPAGTGPALVALWPELREGIVGQLDCWADAHPRLDFLQIAKEAKASLGKKRIDDPVAWLSAIFRKRWAQAQADKTTGFQAEHAKRKADEATEARLSKQLAGPPDARPIGADVGKLLAAITKGAGNG